MKSMSYKLLIAVVGCVLLMNVVSAQEVLVEELDSLGYTMVEGVTDSLNITQDARIDSLVQLHIEKNKQRGAINGYRLQIFSTSGVGARERARTTKANYLKNYPEHDIYILFKSPDWRVRVGNFRSKTEALKVKSDIRRDYPDAYIVPDLIDYPELEKRED
ncbi:SPOR domain-containing protein [Puteibacter caeruleilacunae]|nr:SPOR domain-containing protein [Puteibacter caeruleilacunae]